MSKHLHQAIFNVLEMGYFANQCIRSGGQTFGHEEAVALKIKEAGFLEASKENFPYLTSSLIKYWADTGDSSSLDSVLQSLPKGSYILHPAGSQCFPDILVKDFTGKLAAIECKSGKNGLCPMWNDNVPKQHALYILSSGIANETTVFLGRDVITQDAYKVMSAQEDEIEAIVQKYNRLMEKVDTFRRGWVQKSRKQHFQAGGKSLTNYFTHTDRARCEEQALQWALSL